MTTLKITNHYNKLFEESIEKIKADNYQVDDLIDSTSDNRFGITLLIRPNNYVKNKVQYFLNELRTIEPRQYYYPNSDIHLTVISIITCHNGFNLGSLSISSYVDVIKEVSESHKGFQVDFKGITASPSCIMIKGFPKNNTLNDIRDNLRRAFANSGLQQSIDTRYRIQTAHSTVVRLREKLTNKDKFLTILDKYRNYDFGTFTVNMIELVYNDWYHRRDNVRLLYKFNISPQ